MITVPHDNPNLFSVAKEGGIDLVFTTSERVLISRVQELISEFPFLFKWTALRTDLETF